MSPMWRDAIFFGGHVVPIHACLGFDFLPSQAVDAGQLHGGAQHGFGIRRDVDAYRPTRWDWKGHGRLRIFISSVSRNGAGSGIQTLSEDISFFLPDVTLFEGSRFNVHEAPEGRRLCRGVAEICAELLEQRMAFVISFGEINPACGASSETANRLLALREVKTEQRFWNITLHFRFPGFFPKLLEKGNRADGMGPMLFREKIFRRHQISFTT